MPKMNFVKCLRRKFRLKDCAIVFGIITFCVVCGIAGYENGRKKYAKLDLGKLR